MFYAFCHNWSIVLCETKSKLFPARIPNYQAVFRKVWILYKFGFVEKSKLLDFTTMPAPTESISLSISLLETSFYRPIPAILAKTVFRPISSDCFSFVRLSNTLLYPFSSNGIPFAIRYSFMSSHSCHNASNNTLLSVKVSSSSKPCGGV